MTQFLRVQASDSEEVVTPLMLDGTYLSRNFATLGPLTRAAAVCGRRYAKTQDHKAMNQRLNLTSRSSRQQTVEKSEKMFQEFSFPLVPRSTFQSCG